MRLKMPAISALLGAAIGFLVISPFSMYLSHVVHIDEPVNLMRISEVFGTRHLVWTLSYTLFGAVIGAVVGVLYRSVKERSYRVERTKSYADLIVNSFIDGMLTIGPDLRVRNANRAFLEASGYTLDEVIGKHCYEISHKLDQPCDLSHSECPVKKVLETGESVRVTHTHLDKDNKEIYVELSACPVRDENGEIIEVIELSRDITEHRMLERQLLQAQKMEAVGQLAGGVAHDFNNILTAIMGHGSFIHMRMDRDDPLQSHVKDIRELCERSSNLVKSLLALSRTQVIDPHPLGINAVLDNVQKLLVRVIGEHIALKIEQSKEPLVVMADHVQIDQALLNLATNARDAMMKGGTLTIRTEPAELTDEFIDIHGYGEKGRYALISVSDTGIGMDNKTKRKIFEPFFTTKDTGKGSGLGLTMVYGMVKQNKGYITVDSKRERGTTFRIYLPLIDHHIDEGEQTSGFDPELYRGEETILFAEDDTAIRNLFTRALENAGYTVIEAMDGQDAIEKFRSNSESINLLFLDVMMPKKNGGEVYEEARQIAPSAKVLFYSGYSDSVMNQHGIDREGLDFLPKPVSINDLLKKVRYVLDK